KDTIEEKVPSKAAKKTASSDKKGDKKKSKKRVELYSAYTYKVLKEIHPDMGISSPLSTISLSGSPARWTSCPQQKATLSSDSDPDGRASHAAWRACDTRHQ
ncbi:hypothetical protein THAOC_26296, partial [Thalassiosira oceanica]